MITLYSIKQIGITTHFIWVPGHVGIQGIEKVDKMTKESFEAFNMKWQTYWNRSAQRSRKVKSFIT